MHAVPSCAGLLLLQHALAATREGRIITCRWWVGAAEGPCCAPQLCMIGAWLAGMLCAWP
jgi:hypothetical protein